MSVIATIALVTAFAIGDGYTPGAITASGLEVRPGITLACDPDHYEFGQHIWIHGVGVRVCQDTGGAIKGPHRFDLALSSPQEALNFGRQSLRYATLPLPQANPERPLRIFRGKTEEWRCSYFPTVDGAYTARHCLANVHGPGWTIYAGTQRVTRFSLDPSRDLAHMVVGGSNVTLRTPQSGELAGLRSSVLVAGEVEAVQFYGTTYTVPARRWCVMSGQWFVTGISGDGIIGTDGALLGIVAGGTLGNDYAWGDPYCYGGQAIFATEVP